MLVWVAGIGAVVCLVYYIVIVLYAGFSTSFSGIWLVGAAFLGLLAFGMWYCRRYPKRLPLWIPVSAVTFLAASLAIFCSVAVMVFLGAASSDVANLDYVIVLGAQVKDGGISNSLRQRLDKAIEYSQMNPGTILVLSGGQGPDEPVSEAKAMYDYLLYNGVPQEQMVMEHVSASTVENIAYSKVLIDHMEEERLSKVEKGPGISVPGPYIRVEDKPLQVGVLTSNFHVFRAKKIAEKWGMEGIHGIPSKSDPILFPHLCVRECVAILKDKLMGNM